ncbi:MAG: sulfatase/phosphatase domain-containing protein [Planctomycetota bacterium]|nr:sulfatase/phosphatase domain-containing protein [Planctomycetota bacterium]
MKKTASIITATLALTFCSAGGLLSKERPNILFIFSDDHSFEAISAYGGRLKDVAPTPNLDRIASEGIRFDNCFVTNALCGPCRAVIQTGKHSHLNGFLENHHVFNGDQQTFPKLLQKGGYQTALIGKWHLGSEPQGFDLWNVLPGQGTYYAPEFKTPAGKTPGKPGEYVTEAVVEKSIAWLKNGRDKKKPFMLMVQHKAPHRFWLPPVKYLKEYTSKHYPEPKNLFDDYEGRGTPAHTQDMTLRVTMDLALDNKMVPFRQDRMNAEQRKQWNEVYDEIRARVLKERPQGDDMVRWKYQRYMADYLACIRSLDDSVGTLLDYLETSGLDKNTVVIYASDQGFFLGEHGWFDKRFMYEESLRTPLLVRWPGKAKPGTVNKHMVSNLDFAQTFLDLAGLELPGDMQGRSLKPLFEGKSPEGWRESVYYHYYCFPEYHAVRRHDGVRNSRYKLMHFYDIDEWELFDLAKDPSEMRSVHASAQYAGVLKHMKGELAKLRKQYKVPPAPKLRKGETLFPPWPEFGTFEIGLGNEGWTSLFDGKTLKGWRQPGPSPATQIAANDSMKVVNGEIHLSPAPKVFYLHTRSFTDFILELEAKMPDKDFDSGVGFRCVLPKGAFLPKGFQSEISDIRSGGIFDIGVGWVHPTEKQEDIDSFVKRTGTFYKQGKWNQIRVRCQGSRIQTWVNGQLSSDIENATHKSGVIGLQHNAKQGIYRFRNIRIRELTAK